jgi:phage terminase large subunit-like protein
MITIDQALKDKNLLGAALGPPDSWSTWLTTLKAAFGSPLTEPELRTFATIAGDRAPPTNRVNQLWGIRGRGSGKSRTAGAISTYVACFGEHDLDPGEVGYVLTLAGSRDQAKMVHSYIAAFLRSSPILRKMIKNVTAHEIQLSNHVNIAVHSNNFRLIRGRTLLACVFDEIAFWRDDTSANPDIEVYRAVRPSLARTGGLLVGISSPYRKNGLLHSSKKQSSSSMGDGLNQRPTTLAGIKFLPSGRAA